MPELRREEILEGAKKAFFDALLDGYAGGENRKSVKTVSNDGCTKTVVFTDGNYKVVDEWHTNPGSIKSAGTTTIFFQGFPVWWMCYGGEYSKEVIHHLKSALKSNYERGVFNGGRGPSHLVLDKHKQVEYHNHWKGDFYGFSGDESIHSYEPGNVNRLGFHKYFGMALI